MGIGASASDEKDVGVTFLADLVYSSLDLGPERKSFVNNFRIVVQIDIVHLNLLHTKD